MRPENFKNEVRKNQHEPTFVQEMEIWQNEPELLYAEKFPH